MTTTYKIVSETIRKSDFLKKKSLSSKDYSKLIKANNTKRLADIIEHKTVGESLLSKDFLTADICDRYRFLKTANLYKHRYLIDYTTVEYCKPAGEEYLEEGDILIAKDGGKDGLGEVSYYKKDSEYYTDYISGEVLRIRIKEEYDKWYIFAMLKSKYFKEYLDIVTPEGSTLRHSKLLSLEFNVPFPLNDKLIEKTSLLVRNLIDKEEQLSIKRKKIDDLIKVELEENNISKNDQKGYNLPRINEIKKTKRIDTGIYNKEYFEIENKIKNYKGGYFYLTQEEVKPGRTPDDYFFTDNKTEYTYSWVTPTNMESLELLFDRYIYTKSNATTKDYSVILSAVRHLGYGYFVDKHEIVYCNQNTLIIII